MTHDIFISYSSKDKHTADAICHYLEENGLKCWIAPRNIAAGKDYADELMTGLKKAKIVVLVFSKNAQESIYVTREIETAFSNNKPIITYKIDETLPHDKMNFFLKNKHWLDAYPNPETHFKTLLRDAKRLCAPNPKNIKIKGFKLAIIAAVIIVVLIAVFTMTGSSPNSIKIDHVSVDDDSILSNDWNYSYQVYGTIPDELINQSKLIHTDFYDASGNIIQSNDTPTNASFTSQSLMGEAHSGNDNIVKVSVELRDDKGTIISQDVEELP